MASSRAVDVLTTSTGRLHRAGSHPSGCDPVARPDRPGSERPRRSGRRWCGGFGGVGGEGQDGYGDEGHRVVGQFHVADHGVVEHLDSAAVQAHVVRAPAGTERLAADGELADQLGELLNPGGRIIRAQSRYEGSGRRFLPYTGWPPCTCPSELPNRTTVDYMLSA